MTDIYLHIVARMTDYMATHLSANLASVCVLRRRQNRCDGCVAVLKRLLLWDMTGVVEARHRPRECRKEQRDDCGGAPLRAAAERQQVKGPVSQSNACSLWWLATSDGRTQLAARCMGKLPSWRLGSRAECGLARSSASTSISSQPKKQAQWSSEQPSLSCTPMRFSVSMNHTTKCSVLASRVPAAAPAPAAL